MLTCTGEIPTYKPGRYVQQYIKVHIPGAQVLGFPLRNTALPLSQREGMWFSKLCLICSCYNALTILICSGIFVLLITSGSFVLYLSTVIYLAFFGSLWVWYAFILLDFVLDFYDYNYYSYFNLFYIIW